MKLRNRHRLRRKEVRALRDQMLSAIRFSPIDEDSQIDIAQMDDWTVVLEGDEIVGVYLNDRPFPTIRGILRRPPTNNYVTIDMGAVKFVVNGADVMTPGIVEADQDIQAGDAVWVRDETHKKPIAIGIALISGTEMNLGERGKAVKNLHYVGDSIWSLGIG